MKNVVKIAGLMTMGAMITLTTELIVIGVNKYAQGVQNEVANRETSEELKDLVEIIEPKDEGFDKHSDKIIDLYEEIDNGYEKENI